MATCIDTWVRVGMAPTARDLSFKLPDDCSVSALLTGLGTQWLAPLPPRAWVHLDLAPLSLTATLTDIPVVAGTRALLHILPANRRPLWNPAWRDATDTQPYFATQRAQGGLPTERPPDAASCYNALTPPVLPRLPLSPTLAPTAKAPRSASQMIRVQVRGLSEFALHMPLRATVQDLLHTYEATSGSMLGNSPLPRRSPAPWNSLPCPRRGRKGSCT